MMSGVPGHDPGHDVRGLPRTFPVPRIQQISLSGPRHNAQVVAIREESDCPANLPAAGRRTVRILNKLAEPGGCRIDTAAIEKTVQIDDETGDQPANRNEIWCRFADSRADGVLRSANTGSSHNRLRGSRSELPWRSRLRLVGSLISPPHWRYRPHRSRQPPLVASRTCQAFDRLQYV